MTSAADLRNFQKSLQKPTVEDDVERLINRIKDQIELDPSINSYYVYKNEITDEMLDLLKKLGYQVISGWVREAKNNWDNLPIFDIRW